MLWCYFMKETVLFDEKNGILTLFINPRMYAQTIVMRATYRFIDDFDVKVDGDPMKEFVVVFKSKTDEIHSMEDLIVLSDSFFTELIHTSVEESQARRYADIRNALVGAALRNMMPPVDVEKLAEKMSEKTKK